MIIIVLIIDHADDRVVDNLDNPSHSFYGHAGLVFLIGNIPTIMLPVFNAPFAAHNGQQAFRICFLSGHRLVSLPR